MNPESSSKYHRVKVTATVEVESARNNADLDELIEYTENTMRIRLQQGNMHAVSMKTEVVE